MFTSAACRIGVENIFLFNCRLGPSIELRTLNYQSSALSKLRIAKISLRNYEAAVKRTAIYFYPALTGS